MFDDLKQNNSGQPPQSNAAPVPEKQPSQPNSQNNSDPSEKLEDIFSDTDDSPKKPDIFKPKDQTAAGLNQRQAEIDQNNYETNISQANNLKKVGIFIGIVLGLFIIVWVGYAGTKKFLSGSSDNNVYSEVQQMQEDVEDNSEMNEVDNTQNQFIDNTADTGNEPGNYLNDNTDTYDEEPAFIDTDEDGLEDIEEEALGTDINSTDTDNDGLFDREEVYVYKTDPLNADTDGDSYLDGAEVEAGYNPKGPGKLYEL